MYLNICLNRPVIHIVLHAGSKLRVNLFYVMVNSTVCLDDWVLHKIRNLIPFPMYDLSNCDKLRSLKIHLGKFKCFHWANCVFNGGLSQLFD